MEIKYKKIEEIDFTKVASYEYALNEYFDDVSFYVVASHYLKLNHLRDEIFDYELSLKDNKKHYLRINNKKNNCLLDFNPINVEQLVLILETKTLSSTQDIDVNSIIKYITNIDLENYINHVYYDGGGEDYIKITRLKK